MQAVLMLKTTFLSTPLLFDLFCRWNMDVHRDGCNVETPENIGSWGCHNYGEEIMIVGRTMRAQSTSVTDGQIYDD